MHALIDRIRRGLWNRRMRRLRGTVLSAEEIGWCLAPYTALRAAPKSDGEALARCLKTSKAFSFERYRIDSRAFNAYCAEEDYEGRFPQYAEMTSSHDAFTRKRLEHFIGFEQIAPTSGGVYIDVAAATSPVSDVMRRRFGAEEVYRQDIRYRHGVYGREIGGDAASIPLPNASVDGMFLHNSWEHFEGDSDVRCLQECARLLRPGAKVIVVPLVIAEPGYQVTSPSVWAAKSGGDLYPKFDRRLLIVVDESSGQRLVKYHSPQTFEDTVRAVPQMRFAVYRVRTTGTIDFNRISWWA